MKELADMMRAVFYFFGVVAIIFVLNTQARPHEPKNKSYSTEVVTNQVINKEVIEHNYFTANNIGAAIIGLFTLFVVIGTGYAFVSTRPKNLAKTNKPTKTLRLK